MKRSSKQAVASSVALLATLVGCADVPATETELSVVEQEIIGGVPANSASLNAVGALTFHIPVVDFETGETRFEYFPLCTGSLISSQTVLTAKHCTESFESPENSGFPAGTRLFFHIGPDAQKPLRAVEIVAVERAPGDEGGFIGRGRDVATYHLLEKVTDLPFLTLGALETRNINQPFATIGYGVQDNAGKSGTRFAGTETLNGISGRVLELMFGSFEAFRDWFDWAVGSDFSNLAAISPAHRTRIGERAQDGGASGGGSDGAATGSDGGEGSTGSDSDAGTTGGDADGGATGGADDSARALYESLYLLEGYEAYTGNRDGNAQSCYGDSGGPLVKTVNGKLRAFGVTSGGLYSKELVCDYGTIYATFGKDVMDFLNKSKKWVDPCKGLSTEGVCERDVVKRCTNASEGPRRVTKTNCGLLAQTCGVNDEGTIGCVDR